MKKITLTTAALALVSMFAFGATAMAADTGSAAGADAPKAATKTVKKSVKKHSAKKKASSAAPKSE